MEIDVPHVREARSREHESKQRCAKRQKDFRTKPNPIFTGMKRWIVVLGCSVTHTIHRICTTTTKLQIVSFIQKTQHSLGQIYYQFSLFNKLTTMTSITSRIHTSCLWMQFLAIFTLCFGGVSGGRIPQAASTKTLVRGASHGNSLHVRQRQLIPMRKSSPIISA